MSPRRTKVTNVPLTEYCHLTTKFSCNQKILFTQIALDICWTELHVEKFSQDFSTSRYIIFHNAVIINFFTPATSGMRASIESIFRWLSQTTFPASARIYEIDDSEESGADTMMIDLMVEQVQSEVVQLEKQKVGTIASFTHFLFTYSKLLS